MILEILSRTDVGQQRLLNEDSLAYSTGSGLEGWVVNGEGQNSLSAPGPVVVILADGMGGSEAGEIASSLAIKTMQEHLQSLFQHMPSDQEDIIRQIKQGFLLAHDRIISEAIANAKQKGMGTTLIAGILHEGHAFIVWSGDSRLYRYFPSETDSFGKYHAPHLQLLTQDHSMVWQMVQQGELTPEEARVHPYSNIITQSLGDTQSRPRPDYLILPIYQGDLLLFCSDGLNSMLSDDQIKELCAANPDLRVLADTLVEEANLAGGTDNISVVLARVQSGFPRPHLQNIGEQDRVITIGGADLAKVMQPDAPNPGIGSLGKRRNSRVRWAWGLTIMILFLAAFFWVFRQGPIKSGQTNIGIDSLGMEEVSSHHLDTVGFFGELSTEELADEVTTQEGKRMQIKSKYNEPPFWQGKFDTLLQQIMDLRGQVEKDNRLSLETRKSLSHEIDSLRKDVEGQYNLAVQQRLFGNEAQRTYYPALAEFNALKVKYNRLLDEIHVPGPLPESEYWRDKFSGDSIRGQIPLEIPQVDENGSY